MRRAILLALLAIAALPAGAAAAPISSHAQLYACCTPLAMKERIFAESKALGAAFIRVDVQINDVFEDGSEPADEPDWRGLDEVIELSRRYQLPVLGVLLGTPSYVSTCPERWPDAARCAAADTAEYGGLVGEIAAHARATIRHWEIVNEPDGEWAFEGSAEEYARMLGAAYDAVEAAAPEATVAMGGVMRPHDPAWLRRVLATPGAAGKFDVANLHMRGRLSALVPRLQAWRALLAEHGFSGPVWVTELGYPGDPAFQVDPAFAGGEQAQADYLTEALVALGEAGADQVFVTLRDNLEGRYATEGVVSIDEAAGHAVRRKPAFEALRRLAQAWDSILAWRGMQRWHEQLGAAQAALAETAAVQARVERRALHDARAAARHYEQRLLARAPTRPRSGHAGDTARPGEAHPGARRSTRIERPRRSPRAAGQSRSARRSPRAAVPRRGAERSLRACADALLLSRRPARAGRAARLARRACELRAASDEHAREYRELKAVVQRARDAAFLHGLAATHYAGQVRGG